MHGVASSSLKITSRQGNYIYRVYFTSPKIKTASLDCRLKGKKREYSVEKLSLSKLKINWPIELIWINVLLPFLVYQVVSYWISLRMLIRLNRQLMQHQQLQCCTLRPMQIQYEHNPNYRLLFLNSLSAILAPV